MTYRIARSLASLRSEVNAAYPDRDKRSDGWIGDPSHSARVSDHNPDGSKPLGIVRALDLDKDDKDGSRANIAQTVVDAILRTRDPRVKYVIWRGRIFSSYNTSRRKAWEWGPYTGANGHFEHVHVSVVGGTAGDRSGPWGIRPATSTATRPTPTPEPEDPMPDAAQIAATVWGATFGRGARTRTAGQLLLEAHSAAHSAQALSLTILDAVKDIDGVDADALSAKVAEAVQRADAQAVADVLEVKVRD